MKDSRLQFVLVFGLAILLVVLGFFQYKWVSQISQAEQERLQKRLDIDAKNFADEFNRILQTAYFNFQFNGENWQNDFLQQYQAWQQNAPYPGLIKQFSVILPTHEIARFEPQSMKFVTFSYTKFDSQITNFEPIDEANLTLTMPIYEQPNRFVLMSQTMMRTQHSQPVPPVFPMPTPMAMLVLKLDENVIKTQILNDLTKKYFPEGDFKISINSKNRNENIFQMESLENPDASVPMFDLMPQTTAYFVNQNLWTTLNSVKEKNRIILNQRFESRVLPNGQTQEGQVKIQVLNGKENRIIDRNNLQPSGRWVLNIQHKNGSLAQFVGSSRRRNLLIGFGILGLLGGSVGLIFLSAYRAQVLAQRQLDFVSSVSHEFRTPIAVIYSAGENLADGVAREGSQVSRYGSLIKGEGKKLSAMVEQILEFAGARSGRKKYDFREIEVKKIVESAINDCAPLIAEKHFEIETDIQENLPAIQADANSLSHAVQNLIINGIKYSNGSNWLKISAQNGGGTIKISVEDHGIGIAKKDLKQIFAPFYRAKDVVDAQIHGNGLGLSLVKQTIDAHHGKVQVESEIGKGSKFILHLPFVKNDE